MKGTFSAVTLNFPGYVPNYNGYLWLCSSFSRSFSTISVLKYRVIYWHVRTLALIFKSLITINDPANLPLKEPLDYRAINNLPLVNWLNVKSFLVNFSFVVFKPFTLLSHFLKSIFSNEEAVLLLYFFSLFFFMSSIKLHASSILMARDEILHLLVSSLIANFQIVEGNGKSDYERKMVSKSFLVKEETKRWL